MSTSLPDRPTTPPPAGAAYALVVSRYNPEFTNALAESARAELLAIDPTAQVEIHSVPGAFEIPLLVELLARQQRHAAILALGLILQGETAHAELVARTVTDSLQATALRHAIPVIHEVLLVTSVEQARARCLDPQLNRGTEAARTAATMAATLASLPPAPPITNYQSPITC